jgi:hypothetical protein
LRKWRFETETAAIDVGRDVLGVREGAGQLIGPVMVSAGDFPRRSLSLAQDPCAAMAAYVVERAHLAVVAANYDHRVLADLDGDVVARLGDFGRGPDVDPAPREDRGDVELEYLRIEVEGRLKGVAISPPRDQPRDVACRELQPTVDPHVRLPDPASAARL